MPFAIVEGAPVTELPKDLYIPPDALEVILEAFEGPLDLLLYLIRRQNLDILNIPIADITHQYMEYVELMTSTRLELASDYLVMAAMLAEIKSRMLLPRPESIDDDDDIDPRAELVRRLLEYERFKQAAEDLDQLPQLGRDVLAVKALTPHVVSDRPQPAVKLDELLKAVADVLRRSELFAHHHIKLESLSVRERMSNVLRSVRQDQYVDFETLFDPSEGRLGIVVTLLALLELLKDSLIELVQNEAFAPIYVKAAGSAEAMEIATEDE